MSEYEYQEYRERITAQEMSDEVRKRILGLEDKEKTDVTDYDPE